MNVVFSFCELGLLTSFQFNPLPVQVPYEQTKAINQWRSVGKSPFSDECLVQLTSDDRYDDSGNLLVEDETRGVYLTCTYEEDISTASAQRRFASYQTNKRDVSACIGQARCEPRRPNGLIIRKVCPTVL